jgi:preprotein translocase subunit SecE
VSKKADSIMSERDDPSDLTPSAPRTESFGEGVEGQAARRERGVAGAGGGPIQRVGQFFHDVRVELKRVTWPTWPEVKNTTVITLITMVFFAAFLFVVDEIWAFLIDHLIKLLGGA